MLDWGWFWLLVVGCWLDGWIMDHMFSRSNQEYAAIWSDGYWSNTVFFVAKNESIASTRKVCLVRVLIRLYNFKILNLY